MTDFRNLGIKRKGLIQKFLVEIGEYIHAFRLCVRMGERVDRLAVRAECPAWIAYREQLAEFHQRVKNLERLLDEGQAVGIYTTLYALREEANDRKANWLINEGISSVAAANITNGR